ncbi:Transcriptional repressor CTCF-like [Mycena sanguinolenta]|uniref:Transcriptional repressor CTCF-like n=1 Tax=Mycena sanguinolenta TaxID=230812 RepID=A0A8H7CPF5_9AGAR|nr:Transcriptional repressor CTCF-like [Mycena sanguinolenta]
MPRVATTLTSRSHEPTHVGKSTSQPATEASIPQNGCPWSFRTKTDLRRHLPRHMAPEEREKQYGFFSALLSLSTNCRRMYKCSHPGCTHKSLQKSNVDTHFISKHTGLKPHVCKHCPYSTSDPACLHRHMRSIHAYVSGTAPHRRKSNAASAIPGRSIPTSPGPSSDYSDLSSAAPSPFSFEYPNSSPSPMASPSNSSPSLEEPFPYNASSVPDVLYGAHASAPPAPSDYSLSTSPTTSADWMWDQTFEAALFSHDDAKNFATSTSGECPLAMQFPAEGIDFLGVGRDVPLSSEPEPQQQDVSCPFVPPPSQTCTTLREYAGEKAFWLIVLARVHEQELHPIALPAGQDLLKLTTAELRDAALRTNRIMKNWSSQSPKPEAVREMRTDSMADIIIIPGTGLVVTHSRAFVACWDIYSKSCVGRLELRDRDLAVESASFEEYGMIMLGVFSLNKSFRVAAICIDYHDRRSVSIHTVLVHTFNFARDDFYKVLPVSVHHGAVHLVVATRTEPYEYRLLSISLIGEERIIQNILPQTMRRPFLAPPVASISSSHGSYFIRHMGPHADIAHLPLQTFRPEPSISQVAAHFTDESQQLKIFTPAVPTAEVVYIAFGQYMVEFWRARNTITGFDFGDVSKHTIDWDGGRIAVGASGIYILLVVTGYVGLGRAESPWRLLRYVPGESPVIRDLKVPGKTLHLNEGRLALDDHLGLIFCLRADGTLRIVSYA